MINLQPLQVQDIPFGMQLKTQAHWNQLPADWETLLGMSEGGSYLAHWQQEPAGTVTTIQYGQQFSWIGMVLVAQRFRGLGIGTQLLKAAIDYARPMGPVLLDATPQGRKLYLSLGFSDICPLERMEVSVLKIPEYPSGPQVRPMRVEDLPACMAFDAPHFGHPRAKLLNAFFLHTPEYACVCVQDGELQGYCLGRHGSRFEQLGPLVARDERTARALFWFAGRRLIGKPVIMDIMSEQADWRSFLLELGFSVQRPFMRMSLGNWTVQGKRSGQFAIAGPEFG
jgi:GNAT superfamily N-acetyltransferase